MTARALMLQGTGSDVGKSLLVAGLCRAFLRRGLRVRPFKPQNMSNNAAVASDGGEIGRAQALQARAAGVAPTTDMNPVLLKPQTEIGAQVIVQGRVAGNAQARELQSLKPSLLPRVLESFARLRRDADLVLVEGAGSAAEVNLRAGDIANMGFALTADVPVVLVGDIDRGGVIAQVVGTWALLADAERALTRGYVVNKFRGDPSLFADGIGIIGGRTGLPSLGIVPWFDAARRLPAEDAMQVEGYRPRDGRVRVAVPVTPRIANFDDLDPLIAEEGVRVDMVRPGRALPGDADLIVLAGTKATIADLRFLKAEGWDIDIRAHVRRGGRVIGLCGGYQMLGRRVADPLGIEGPPGEETGVGLLDAETELAPTKRLAGTDAVEVATGHLVRGYLMHMGRTTGPDTARPFLVDQFLDPHCVRPSRRPPTLALPLKGGGENTSSLQPLSPSPLKGEGGEGVGRRAHTTESNHGTALLGAGDGGATSADGLVSGCYLHGLFAADGFRRALLAGLGRGDAPALAYEAGVEATLDALARHLETHLDIDRLLAVATTHGAAYA